ncbi:MAG: hypothetical protein H7Z10_09830 [Gemmatimonadaceae bacterium]|nr:hypothetical protein [Acetobacteraceae bacterium]
MTDGVTGVCCYTSFTYAYLGRALTLLSTLRAAHPEWTVCAVVVDEPPPGLPGGALSGFDIVLGVDDLGIPRARAWLFKHDVIEACTAVKGAAMLHLMDAGFDVVVYLDPDVAVFHPLDPVMAALDRASIVLTPHQASPNGNIQVMRDNELASMRFGVFNLGFIAVRSDGYGRLFAAWWAAQLRRACYDDAASGLFTDQKYIDLVPGLFGGVHILRDPGCNVASWNLSVRRIAIGRDGAIWAGGHPLRFFHFTKIGSVGDIMVDRYGGDSIDALELWTWYRRAVARAQPSGIGPWHYAAFSDGAPIPLAVRLLYRESRDLRNAFDDPFDAGGPLLAWLRQARPDLLTATPAATSAAGTRPSARGPAEATAAARSRP